LRLGLNDRASKVGGDMSFRKGDRVRHTACSEWGLGEVLVVEPTKVRVFFVNAGERVLSAGAPLERVDGTQAANPVLDNLHIVSGARFRTIGECKGRFLSLFPRGFSDPKFVANGREYKISAHDLFSSELGRERMESLLTEGRHEEVLRLAQQV